MTREECIKVLDSLNDITILYNYCIHKGKAEKDTFAFIAALRENGVLNYYCNYAFDELCREFNISTLLDSNGHFIKVVN